MEIPVIGTNWSGHTDFMNERNAFLIDIKGLLPNWWKLSIGKAVYSERVTLRQPSVRRDICLICVGTPSDRNGYPDLSFIWHVANQISEAIKGTEKFQTILIRSTVPPATCREMEQIISRSGKRIGQDFAVVSNPEFLREGTSIEDYFHPPYTLIGTHIEDTLYMLQQIYDPINAPILETDREVAEMIKYVNNSSHALKVVFANEIAALCYSMGVDPHILMDLFVKDRHLNKKVRVGVLDLAFKSGTDDVRESPVVKLLERLIGKGYEIMIYDQNVLASQLMGTNKQIPSL